MSRVEVVATFQASLAIIKRNLKQLHKTDGLTVKPRPGRSVTKRATLGAHVDQELVHDPDVSWQISASIGYHLRRRGQFCHHESVVRRLAWTRKKTLGATECDEQQLVAFRHRLTQGLTNAYVVLDESGTNLNLTPRYARPS